MSTLSSIIPIFSVILLGWLARNKGFIPAPFMGPANRLVYYFAIPAMVFRALAKGSLRNDFNPQLLGCTLGAIAICFGLSWALGHWTRMPDSRTGSFVQAAFHGNLGYIGLAVCFYFLGQEGFTSAGILVGFVMILQNFLAVTVLQFYSDSQTAGGHHSPAAVVKKITGNPVVMSALAGMLFSLTGLGLPLVVDRGLDIISGMALPLALILIGASLNFELMKARFRQVLAASLIKLGGLPAVGLALFMACGLSADVYMPGLILLASPTATVSYVMAMELNGDTEFAVAAISTSTLLSALTYSLWLHLSAPV